MVDNAFKAICDIFARHSIDEVSSLPISCTEPYRPYMLDEKDYRSCIVFLIPYLTPENKPVHISKYAAVRDYHMYTKELYESLTGELATAFPEHIFKCFADCSPVNEKLAAARSGLGVIGKSSLLINKRYGSYVFIGSVVTTLDIGMEAKEAQSCISCGKCIQACPGKCLGSSDFTGCISYISQKKERSTSDMALLKKLSCAWGCDVCQDVCPMNKKVDFSPISFFSHMILSDPSSEEIAAMSDEEFSERAFSWRGRKVIIDNLQNVGR
ncbi:MAG TPA: DUF1730 domain-containing protein [Bacillota bacterium]|nr:DUF1730 domain-containing protein [Bacillota bacterium]